MKGNDNMLLADYKVRIIANACITRYDRGEGDIVAVVDSYSLSEENKNLVLAQIYAYRPDIEQTVNA